MEAKEDIKRRLSVEDVVGSYLELKRSGRNFKAISPFKTEKTPSFMVSPDKQIWHDFSANKGGDIFSFVMEMEGVDFVGAMEILAQRAGLDLSQYQRGSGQTAKLKKRLYDACELAAKYYHATLAKNPSALNYLRQNRGYSADTIKAFSLGFAPSEGTALYRFLIKKNYTPAELTRAGLIVNRRGQPSDMFRGRIMIPLMDGQGRIIGFTARLLRDDPRSPKYINTPQTLIYDKSRHVFGLHLAKTAMREQDFAAVVEGNLDVIASWQAGVANCVATAGTALTKDHLQQIQRLTTNVKLAFDQDEAGIAATVRAIPIAYELGVNISIVTLDGGKDPDEIIKKDPTAWAKALQSSTYVLDWLVNHFAKELDLDTPQGKRRYSELMSEVLIRVTDPVEREHYVGVVSEKTGVSIGRIEEKLKERAERPGQKRRVRTQSTTTDQQQMPTLDYVDTFLGMMVLYEDTRDALPKLNDVRLEKDVQQELLTELINNPGIPEKELQTDEGYVKIVTFRAEEYYGEFSSSARLADAMKTARRIADETKKKRMSRLADAMRVAKDSADQKAHDLLLRKVHQALKED